MAHSVQPAHVALTGHSSLRYRDGPVGVALHHSYQVYTFLTATQFSANRTLTIVLTAYIYIIGIRRIRNKMPHACSRLCIILY